jgi:hypothetical protein
MTASKSADTKSGGSSKSGAKKEPKEAKPMTKVIIVCRQTNLIERSEEITTLPDAT